MNRMKLIATTLVLIVTAITSVILTHRAYAFDSSAVIVIKPGRDRDVSKAELWRRIYQLERAVEQLQDKVFELSKNQPPAANAMITCFIETPFNGTFMETAATETAAQALTLKKCGDATNNSNVFCSRSKLQCGK